MPLKTIDIVILLVITGILFLDHFISEIPHNLLAWVFAGVILYSLNYKKYKEVSLKEVMNWQMLSTVIIVVLVVLFTIIGPVQDPGISVTSGMFFFVVLLSLFEIVYQRRQIKQGTDDR